MQPSSNDFYDEVIEEEEYFEEDDDGDSMGDEELLAFVKTSLQDEYRQRQGTASREEAAKTALLGTSKESSQLSLPVAVDFVVELEVTSDSTSVYEEIVVGENSFTGSQGHTEKLGIIDSNHNYSQAGEHIQEQDRDEVYVESIKSSMERLSLQTKPTQQESPSDCASHGSQTGAISEYIEEIEVEEGYSESEYEEHVIERWFGSRDQEPENLEAACRVLIPIIYRGENVCADTMIRRTPLSELYKYLKQHYDYKKEIKKDLTEEETESETAQMSVQELFLMRTSGKGQPADKGTTTSQITVNETVSKRNALLTSMSSPRKIRSPWGKGKKGVKMNQSDVSFCSSFDDSQVIYEEISITDFEDSCNVLEESESVFEEIVEETESYDVEVVVEESITSDEAECAIDSDLVGESENDVNSDPTS